MADTQDMTKMGGLRKHMPVTALTMGIATLAIAGVPPLAGFWSKDEILAVAFETGGYGVVLWLIGIVTALLTAFYMTRQFVMVFLGRPRWDEGVHPHESPRVMTVPLAVLAVLSVVGGLVNTPFLGLGLEHFLEPSFEGVSLAHPSDELLSFFLLAGLSVVAGLAGIAMAYLAYNRPQEIWERFQHGFGKLWVAWENAYWIDDLYGKVLVAPGRALAHLSAFVLDAKLVDGAVNGVGAAFKLLGARVRVVQTGFVRNYGVVFVAGLLGLMVWLLARGI